MKTPQIFFGLLLASAAAMAQQYSISTVAGSPHSRGYYGDGGAATAAELAMPLRVAVDSKGNFFIADYQSHLVREVTAAGVITTLAGNGAYSFSGDGGAGTLAALTDVHGLAVDASGNVYIADTGNSRVRRVDASGMITTFAGNGTFGYTGDGAAATAAALERPAGVAVDSAGNVYIADYGSSTVRKVDSKGIITTIAGTNSYGNSGDGGPATKAALSGPSAIALDPAGNIYIGDPINANIRKITTDGNIHTVAANIDAESLAADAAGNIYYPNYLTHTLQKLLPGGAQITLAGTGLPGYSGDGGPGTNAQLNLPYGVALGPSGAIYVADSGNQIIRLLTPVSSSIGIVSAASGLGGAISPGEIVVLYGSGIGPATLTSNTPVNGVFGTQLAGTTVSFDGVNAPLIYTSATQVAAIVPYSEPAGGTATIAIAYQGQTLTASTAIASVAPGIFTSDTTGSGQAAAVNQNGSLNSPATPAIAGGFISLYLTGEGQTSPAGVDGKVAVKPFPQPLFPVRVQFAGQEAVVTYAGAAPGSVAGLMQVNAQIPLLDPQNFPAGPAAIPVTVLVGGVPAQTSVTVAVQFR